MGTEPQGKNKPARPGYHGRNPFKRVHAAWREDLGPNERSAILAWTSFTVTFGATRALTHWIRDGHGPKSGGMSLGGAHFHHYNIGIATLSGLAGAAMRFGERFSDSPVHPIAYGFANALIVDEAALLLKLEDVYWAKEGRESVDLALGAIGVGGVAITAISLLTNSRRRARKV